MRFTLALAALLTGLGAPAAAQNAGTVRVAAGAVTLGQGTRLTTAYNVEVAGGAALRAEDGHLAFTGSGIRTLAAPAPLTLLGLEVDLNGTLVLPQPVSVTGRLGLRAGTLDGAVVLPATTEGTGEDEHLVRLAAIDGDGAATTAPIAYERFYARAGGWRMIAAPFEGAPFASLNDAFHTQGAAGATYETGDPILFAWDAEALAYAPVTDYDEAFDPGRGYFFFAFTEHVDDSPALPTRWRVEGREHPNAVTQPLGYDADEPQRGFALLGNPFAAPLDWHALQAAAGLQAAYHVWDAGTGAYASYSAAGTGNGSAGRFIPAFQGFWAEANAASAYELVFSKAWKAAGESPLYAARSALTHQLRLHLEGEGLASADPVLLLVNGATDGYDPYDAAWPVPLSADYAALFYVLDDPESGAARRLVFESRPPGEPLTVRLGVETTRPGRYTLSWPGLEDAPEGPLVLVDEATGAEVDLRSASSYAFAIAGSAAQPRGESSQTPVAPTASRSATARFTLRVGQTATGIDDGGEPGEGGEEPGLPRVFALEAGYPNPFAASLTLPYALPEAADVRIEVFDALGRRVALLVDAPRPAGRHTASFDGRGLAAGAYVVRFQAGGVVQTQRVTLAR